MAVALELMAITGLTAEELVNLARSAFGAASATVSAARAAALHVFCSDGITGDGRGVDLVGMYSHTPPRQCIAGIIQNRAF